MQAIRETVQQIVHPPSKAEMKVKMVEPKRSEEKMMVAEWRGKEDIRIAEKNRPMVTEPHDVVIRTTSTTICGSDLHLYFNSVPGIKPMEKGDVIGHEFMGIITEVGPDVKNFKPGDRVVVAAVIACGQCEYCKQEKYSLCDTTNPSGQMEMLYGHRTAGLFGYSHLTGGYDGGFEEYVRVPFGDNTCLKVPDTLKDDQVLLLADTVCTGWHANELGNVCPGDTVAIWGCGPIGLAAAKWAKFRGAAKVISIDNVAYRLEAAKKLGCDVINFDEVSDVANELLNRYPSGPNKCIDCAGFRFAKKLAQRIERALKLETDAMDIAQQMIKACKKGGTIVLIGDYFDYGNQFPIGAFMEKSLVMTGGQVHVQKYWKQLLGYIESGQFDPTFLITHHMPLSKIAQAFDMFAHYKDNALKIVLRPDSLMQEQEKERKL